MGVEPTTFRLQVDSSTSELITLTYLDVHVRWFRTLLKHEIPHVECVSPSGYFTIFHRHVFTISIQTGRRPYLTARTLPYPLTLMSECFRYCVIRHDPLISLLAFPQTWCLNKVKRPTLFSLAPEDRCQGASACIDGQPFSSAGIRRLLPFPLLPRIIRPMRRHFRVSSAIYTAITKLLYGLCLTRPSIVLLPKDIKKPG